MSQMLGADPDVLDHVAGQFGVAAHRFDALRNSLNAAIRHSPWQGPAADQFRAHWDSTYQRMLSAAAEALRAGQTQLAENARQQRQASAGGGGQSGGHARIGVSLAAGLRAAGHSGLGVAVAPSLAALMPGLLAGGRTIWTRGAAIEQWGTVLTAPVRGIEEVASNRDVVGRYSNAWREVMKLDRNGELLRYKSSPVLHWLHDSPEIRKASQVLEHERVPVLLDKLDKAAPALNTLNIGSSVFAAAHDAHSGHLGAAGGDVVDATASGLKMSRNPATYLAGFDVSLFHKDYTLYKQIHWNEGIPSPFSGTNFRDDYVPMFKTLPRDVIKNVADCL